MNKPKILQNTNLSEAVIKRVQELAGSDDITKFVNDINLDVHPNVANLTQKDILEICSNPNSYIIVAFRTYFDKFFQKAHKKRTKAITLLLSQLFYLQLHTSDVRAYIDEEKKNFLAKNQNDRTYEYGYICGKTLEDIAGVCSTTKASISKNISYLEANGYITKQLVSNMTKSIYKTDERVRIRLNLVSLFKDLICSGLNSLDEVGKDLLPAELVTFYQDIRAIIICKNNIELLSKHSDNIDVIDNITLDTLIDCYNVVRNDVITPSKKETIKCYLDDVLMTYSLPNIILAMDNYEIFRNITNRHGYMYNTDNFFTIKVISKFVDDNFMDYLKQENYLDLTEYQLKSGYKTLTSAQYSVLQRKVKESNQNQIMLDICTSLARQYGVNNVSAFTKISVDSCANVNIEHIKQEVDKIFTNSSIIDYFTEYYNRKIYHKDKLELNEVINDAYILAYELLQQKEYEHQEDIKLYIAIKLNQKYNKQFKNDNIKVSTKTNQHQILDVVSSLHQTDDDILHQKDSFDCSHIFNLNLSSKKVLYQILFCLATNDEFVSNFAEEYKLVLNNFYFNFKLNKNKCETFGYSSYQSFWELMQRILYTVRECIDDYCFIQNSELLQLISEKELLTDDIWCEVLIDNKKCEMPIEDIFFNNKIENASQVTNIPKLHKDNRFNQLVQYVAHKVTSETVNGKVKNRFK